MIPQISREQITDLILNYLEDDGLYIVSAQDRARYFRNTFSASTPFGTSGTHSALEIVVESVVHGLTDYYGVSATSANNGNVALYGDVTGSGTSAISTIISNNVVSLGKLAQIQTNSFLGRTTAEIGNVEVIPLTAISSFIDVSEQIDSAIDDALSELDLSDQTITLTGDVTGSGTGSFAATISNAAVTLDKIQDVATASILGRSTGGTGDLEVLSVTSTRNLLGLGTGDTPTFAGINVTTLNFTNLTVSNGLNVSGDFFNPHVSILSDGVISTDNIIYAEYLEVYNTASFDAGVNISEDLIVGGFTNVSGTFSVVGNANFYDTLLIKELNSSNYGGFNVGADAFDTFLISSNLPIYIAAEGAYTALFTDGRLHVGEDYTVPTSTIHGSGSFASGWIAKGSNSTLGDVSFVSITAACTLTIPQASTCPGRVYFICRSYSGGSDCYITRSGSDTIETITGSDTGFGFVALAQYIILVSDGTSTWRIMAGN
jgi:hypothetical protein